MSIFDQGFGFGLHHSTSSPHPHLVNLRTSAFAVSPSPLRWTGTICCPQIRSPHSWVFVEGSSLRGLRLSGRARSSCLVFGSSCFRTAARRWLPNSSPSRLRVLLGASGGSISRCVKRCLKRHPSGERAREGDLNTCNVTKLEKKCWLRCL